MSLVECAGVVLSACGVFLETQRVVLCWPINIIAAGCYFYIFGDQHLYADAALQLLFISLSLYGWMLWRKKPLTSFRPAPTPGWFTTQCCGTIFAGILLGLALSRWSRDPAPYADAMLSASSVLATYWMAQRLRQAWLAWIVTNGAYVLLFLSRGLEATAALYGGFMLLAIYGWFKWRFNRDVAT
ncbi:hypothetical protein CGLAMM_07950 [Acetobacteraceae bacterium EV16G]|uniref:Nicotinamide riboside transporter PnuC n=1 Tax=Sorlinia euscelidii TaxID=3081148 RepID=A0ABU7U2P7_9PROT